MTYEQAEKLANAIDQLSDGPEIFLLKTKEEAKQRLIEVLMEVFKDKEIKFKF